jgi:tetrapyrrole methylase family protein/MazG family protein
LEKLDQEQEVVYAVPGDPSVGEATTTMLRQKAAEGNFNLRVIHGVSFIEPCLQVLGIDALDGLTIIDGIELASKHHPPLNPDQFGLIAQLHSKLLASDVKLTLMNAYPAEHPTILIHAAGTEAVAIERVPLFQVDQSEAIGILTTLLVPPLPLRSSFEALQETIAHLRAPDGCPWDREQTNQSLRPHVLEEAYEVVAALDKNDMQELKEELGDLLLQIVLQTQIATEAAEFQMGEVIAGINEKLIHRHPHVFADMKVDDVDQVLRNWESLKSEEQGADGEMRGLLEGIPTALPALSQAHELQMRAAQVGFDWPDIKGVVGKIREELDEWQEAESRAEAAGEMGDLLFALVNYARWMNIDAEAELQRANKKFRSRFGFIEQQAKAKGLKVGEMSLEEMDAIWEQSKTDPTAESGV